MATISRQPHHIVFMPLSLGEDAWGVFQGIRRYVRRHSRWRVTIRSWMGLARFSLPSDTIGIIAQVGSPDLGDALVRTGLPVVNYDGGFPDDFAFPVVMHDAEAVGRSAALHLMAGGRRHLLALAPADRANARGNVHGFLAAAADAGISADSWLWSPEVESGMSGNSGWIDHLQDRVAACPKPCGIMIWGVTQPVYAMDLLRLRWKVPTEVAVMASSHDRILHGGDQGISGVSQSCGLIGETAARLLVELLADRQVPKCTLIQPGAVFAAASTDPVAVGDPMVSAALTHIRGHAGGHLDVDEVAKAMHISRRSLQRAFLRILGHGVRDEILHWRGEFALSLLRDRRMSTKDVARRLGYAHASHFARALRRSHGVTPTMVREELA